MDLPDLALIEIFSNLNFKRLFNLRIVCKRWKILIECMAKNQDSLFVCFHRCYYPKLKINDKRIKKEEVIKQPFFENFCLAKNYFTNVKKLILHSIRLLHFKNEKLKSALRYILEDLEELYISKVHIISGWDKSPMSASRGDSDYLLAEILDFKNLKFTKLKTLSLLGFGLQNDLALDCPVLENLCLFSKQYMFQLGDSYRSNCVVTFKSYETIKTLKCRNASSYNLKIPNLEHLIFQKFNPFSEFNLLNFPKLKRLDLFPNNIHSLPQIEDVFRQKNQYKNFNDLQILIFGLPISMLDENARNFCSLFVPDIIGYEIERNSDPIKTNYLNLKTDHHPDYKIIYNDSFYDTYQYFSKIDVHKVSAKELKETKILIDFIVKIGGVRSLKLTRCKIENESKEHFKKVPFLFLLQLENCEMENKCDFISDIKKLTQIYIETNYHPFQDFIVNCSKDNFLFSRLVLYDLIWLDINRTINQIEFSVKDIKTFGETVKSGTYKLDILPSLKKIKF